MKARRYKDGTYNHIYQRTINRFNIFYDVTDYLVYYTIVFIAAQKYEVSVLGLCLMIDHIHMLVRTSSRKVLSEFVSYVTSVFVREYNSSIGRRGPLFAERFGSAPKSDKKRLMSAIIYVGNNPVERKICLYSEQYRWNFLAYLDSSFPFSEPLIAGRVSYRLNKAFKEVDRHREDGRYLNHGILNRLLKDLNAIEKEQLVDYIITRYRVIDEAALMSHFEDFSELLKSMHSTTGSEYEINEDFDRMSDNVYCDMIRVLSNVYGNDVRKSIVLRKEEKLLIADEIRRQTAAPMWQIFKFLHLSDVEKCRNIEGVVRWKM